MIFFDSFGAYKSLIAELYMSDQNTTQICYDLPFILNDDNDNDDVPANTCCNYSLPRPTLEMSGNHVG